MALTTFHHFSLLPQDVQDDIWARTTDAPRVHSIELFAMEPFLPGWQEIQRRVLCIQRKKQVRNEEVPLHRGRNLTPLVKLATPLVFPDNGLSSGHDANSLQLARVNSAADEAVTHAIMTRARRITAPLLKVYDDLSKPDPAVPININVEQDLVYLRQAMKDPSVWRRITVHRAGEYEVIYDNDENWPPKVIHQGQTESIQHLLLDYNPEEHWRDCAGCQKLFSHYTRLNSMALERVTNGTNSANRACKMCRRVQQQLQPEGCGWVVGGIRRCMSASRFGSPQADNGASADEAIIRERLLSERMMGLVRRAETICASAANIEAALRLVKADHDDEDDDSDAVSICSNDVNDDFDWYNNSLDALIVETMVFKDGIPPFFLEAPYPSTAAQPPATQPSLPSLSLSTTPVAFPPIITRSQYRAHAHPSCGRNGCPHLGFIPRHGTHPNCNRVRMHTRELGENLPYLFPAVKSLFFLHRGLTLRPGITALPSQGKRWYSGCGRGVYVEVVDPEDDCWVFPVIHTGRQGREPVRPVELVTYLEALYKSGFYWDVDAYQWKEGGDRRNIQVGIVAYLELDDEGRVTTERTKKGERWWPYSVGEILEILDV